MPRKLKVIFILWLAISAILLRKKKRELFLFEEKSKLLRGYGKSEHNVINVRMQLCAVGIKKMLEET